MQFLQRAGGEGQGDLQKQDDDVMTNDSLTIGLCRQLEGDKAEKPEKFDNLLQEQN